MRIQYEILKRFSGSKHDLFLVFVTGQLILLLQTRDEGKQQRVFSTQQGEDTRYLPIEPNDDDPWGFQLTADGEVLYGEQIWGNLSERVPQEIASEAAEPTLNYNLASIEIGIMLEAIK